MRKPPKKRLVLRPNGYFYPQERRFGIWWTYVTHEQCPNDGMVRDFKVKFRSRVEAEEFLQARYDEEHARLCKVARPKGKPGVKSLVVKWGPR